MIELLCIDVDGTLSDGKLHYTLNTDSPEIFKSFNVKDGLGLVYWHKIGKKSAIITGRSNPIVERRAKELNIDFIFMGIKDKGQCVRNLKEKLHLNTESCAAIGDDMNDILMFKEVGISFAPLDCANGIKNIVTINLTKEGGNGAIREAIEYILKKEDLYEEFLKCWQ
ncbi:3-deoxy-D-manno-octulosonate 8-phosphate phosphatase [Helicobacter sp. 16-1353]|uniref:KdsC family phosphatase n=1 Tax=Helicobacter sp. 16-1353 TaxID=2004996 RepID=UPI000DCCC05B|nr:HAD hydrolase family protein [Helicobacter sp. 16-1353]RAX54677.1 3-deoxy-D-manno-octulosonate 8-phosphate phosphatase [Helicobacter sp. 16-1353]